MTTILILTCVFSISLNVVLVWYIRRLIQQLLMFTDSIGSLEEYFNSFDAHLGEIYELEMFYGDETLGGLIKHSKDLLEKIRDFRDSFAIEEIEQPLEDIDDTE